MAIPQLLPKLLSWVELSNDPTLAQRIDIAFLTGRLDGQLESIGELVQDVRKLFQRALKGETLDWNITAHFSCEGCKADLIVEEHRESCAIARAYKIFHPQAPVEQTAEPLLIPEGTLILDKATYYELLANKQRTVQAEPEPKKKAITGFPARLPLSRP